MKDLGRRIDVIEAKLAREGSAQRASEAAEIVAAELRDAGCFVRSVSGGCVIVDEACDRSRDIAARRESRLLSIAARGPAFAAVTVITVRDLSRVEDGGNEIGWVETDAELIFDIGEVARGTVEDLARGSVSRVSSAPQDSTTEDA